MKPDTQQYSWMIGRSTQQLAVSVGLASGDVNHRDMFDDERDTRGGGAYD